MQYEVRVDIPLHVAQREWSESAAISIEMASTFQVDVHNFDETFLSLNPSTEWRDQQQYSAIGTGMVRLGPARKHFLLPKATNRNPRTAVML